MPAVGQARIDAQRRFRARQRGEDVPIRVQKWTAEEEAWLRTAYANNRGTKSGWLRRLASGMGRSAANVCRKARELGIERESKRKGIRRPRQMTLWSRLGQHSRHRIEQRGWQSIPEMAHPRGMLGKHHTPEVRMRMSVTRRGEKRPPITPQTRANMVLAAAERLRKNPGSVQRNRGKGGRRGDLGGAYFRSSWEANYARFLNFTKEPWEYEPKTFIFEAIEIGTRSYTPDFWLPRKGHYIEIKGWMDPKSEVKLKRMAKYFPEVKIEVVGAEWFRQAERNGLDGVIPGWESKRAEARRRLCKELA